MLDRTLPPTAAFTVTLLAALAVPAGALAHGGTTVAEGQRGGVTIRVQSSPSTTESGRPAVDLATTLAGPGSGPGSHVTYYVRPEGGKTFRINTERDEGGVHHADVSTTNRGDANAWDVSAIVMLSDGKRLRVTNASGNAPGPDPAAPRPKPSTPEPSTPEPSTAAPTTPTAGPQNEPVPTTATTDEPVDDISGESDGAPAWVLPSGAAIIALGLFAMAWTRRTRKTDDGDDWN